MANAPAVIYLTDGYCCGELGTNYTTTVEEFANRIMARSTGAVLMECLHAVDLAHEFEARNFPYVVVNLEEDADLKCTAIDMVGIGRQAAALAKRCGYETITCVSGSVRCYGFNQVATGFVRSGESAA